MTDSANIFADIETALQVAEKELPIILTIAGTFYPPVKAVIPFLPLLQTALDSVQVVQQATGSTTAQAASAVQSTLTPGQPNAPALS